MTTEVKTIGVSTGGGDCPGLNPVIRAVVKTAINKYRWRVFGIADGFDGLIWPEKSRELTLADVKGILPRGGTILGTTNRGNPFAYKFEEEGKTGTYDFSDRCIENMKKLGIDALIVIGGDGTLHIASQFYKKGVPVVGVPKTIDNDLSATEVTFGFVTALETATEAIDRLHTTAESHHRIMIIELMGRDAGWIALTSGIAGGADVILIPEIPFKFERISEKILQREKVGSKFSIIVVAEGVKPPDVDPNGKPVPPAKPGKVGGIIGFTLSELTGKEVRVTVLGHIQRGGSPTAYDRILGSRFGSTAVDLVAEGKFGQMVRLHCDRMDYVSLDEAVGVLKTVDPSSDIVRTARALGISFGD